MKKFLTKSFALLKNAKKTIVALVAVAFTASSAFADDLVSVTDGTVTFNPDAIVEPVRDSLVDSITSSISIFVILAGVFFVILMIKKFRRG